MPQIEVQDAEGEDSAGVRVPPPLIFVGLLLVGYGIHRVYPVSTPTGGLFDLLGLLFLVLGIVLFGWALMQFRRHQTDVRPDRPTTAIIRRGPYRLTRNPIYVAGSLVAFGIVLRVGSAWMVGGVALAIGIVNFYVIGREEAYLERKFGQEYLDYKKSVRRWI